MLTTGDVLASHGRVHVGFDGAGCDGVDRDFLVAAVDCLGEGLVGCLTDVSYG
jgi:hypothetical protein